MMQPMPSLSVPPELAPVVNSTGRLITFSERLGRTLGLARALAQNDRRVDLSGIEDGIGLLCAQTMDLPREEGRAMLPYLFELLGQLDSLRSVLSAMPPNRLPPT